MSDAVEELKAELRRCGFREGKKCPKCNKELVFLTSGKTKRGDFCGIISCKGNFGEAVGLAKALMAAMDRALAGGEGSKAASPSEGAAGVLREELRMLGYVDGKKCNRCGKPVAVMHPSKLAALYTAQGGLSICTVADCKGRSNYAPTQHRARKVAAQLAALMDHADGDAGDVSTTTTQEPSFKKVEAAVAPAVVDDRPRCQCVRKSGECGRACDKADDYDSRRFCSRRCSEVDKAGQAKLNKIKVDQATTVATKKPQQQQPAISITKAKPALGLSTVLSSCVKKEPKVEEKPAPTPPPPPPPPVAAAAASSDAPVPPKQRRSRADAVVVPPAAPPSTAPLPWSQSPQQHLETFQQIPQAWASASPQQHLETRQSQQQTMIPQAWGASAAAPQNHSISGGGNNNGGHDDESEEEELMRMVCAASLAQYNSEADDGNNGMLLDNNNNYGDLYDPPPATSSSSFDDVSPFYAEQPSPTPQAPASSQYHASPFYAAAEQPSPPSPSPRAPASSQYHASPFFAAETSSLPPTATSASSSQYFAEQQLPPPAPYTSSQSYYGDSNAPSAVPFSPAPFAPYNTDNATQGPVESAPPPQAPSEPVSSDLANFLLGLSLGSYLPILANEEVIDLDTLRLLDDDDLRDIGISLGARRKIAQALVGGTRL